MSFNTATASFACNSLSQNGVRKYGNQTEKKLRMYRLHEMKLAHIDSYLYPDWYLISTVYTSTCHCLLFCFRRTHTMLIHDMSMKGRDEVLVIITSFLTTVLMLQIILDVVCTDGDIKVFCTEPTSHRQSMTKHPDYHIVCRQWYYLSIYLHT